MASFYKGARIYNLFPRLVGPMPSWKPHLERAKAMGFTWVYVNAFHYPGFSGSIYSVKDFFDFNPLFVSLDHGPGLDQLKDVIETCRSLDLKMMMDLLVNHTAIDHPLIVEHRNWYKTDLKGDLVRPTVLDNGEIVVWGDLAEIDNEDSEDRGNLWNYWWELANFYLALGFEGFRCDAAYKVTPDFWRFLITRAKDAFPQAVFFAETLGCELTDIVRLAKSGFDYTFNSSKWWDFESPWCLEQYRENASFARSVSFPETHDTERLATRCSLNTLKMRCLFSALFSSGFLLPIGFEYGFQKPLHVVNTLPSDWETPQFDLSDFIAKVNFLKSSFRLFNEDNSLQILDFGNPNLFCMLKISTDRLEKALIILNKDTVAYQPISIPSIYRVFETQTPIVDISLDLRMDYIPDQFFYELMPSQVKLFYLYEKRISS